MPSWSVPAHSDRLHAADRDQGHVTWFGYDAPEEDIRDVLPLRHLSPDGAGRVKAHRRQLHEGVLPPALLWWVSGLNTLLVVDGHDRITAALAEHASPKVVVLAPAAEPQLISAVQHRPIREYEGRIEHLHKLARSGDTLAKEHIANVTRGLTEGLGGIARSEGRTRAWPLAGGRVTWGRQAAELAPDWWVGRS